ANGEVRGRDRDLDEFHGVRRRAPQDLALAEFLDEPADECALRAIDARFDPGVVPDRHVRRLHRANGSVFVFADVDISVVHVRADPAAVGVLALRDEVFQDADDARQPRLHDPQADVDRRRAVALERADLDRRVARVRTCETAWPRRVDPLGVLLPATEDVRLTNEAA